MTLEDLANSKERKTAKVQLYARKRKNRNPVENKTGDPNDYIDMFGGMVGYDSSNGSNGRLGNSTNAG